MPATIVRTGHLQQSQLDRMKQVHHRCVILCGLVGFLFTISIAYFTLGLSAGGFVEAVGALQLDVGRRLVTAVQGL